MKAERLQLIFSGILAGCALIITGAVLYRLLASPEAQSPPPFPEDFEALPALPDSLWEPLLQGGHRVGATEPRAILVEFLDYRCAYCRQIHPTLEALLDGYPDLQIIYRHYPLNLNRSAAAARIALCADALGWFERMHTRLFSAQQLDIESLLYDRTESERAAFNSCLYGRDTPVDTLLLQDIALARRVGVTGTPTFFLNGRRVPVGVPASQLRNYVHQALQSESRPAHR